MRYSRTPEGRQAQKEPEASTPITTAPIVLVVAQIPNMPFDWNEHRQGDPEGTLGCC